MTQIGVIGAGKMGEALVRGFLASGINRNTIAISDSSEDRRRIMQSQLHVKSYESNIDLIGKNDIIILAVPPQIAVKVIQEITEAITPHHLIISIVAGLPTSKVFTAAGKRFRLIRAMPNNPCLIGEGMIVLCPTPDTSKEDMNEAQRLFSPLGRIIVTEEQYLNAITGLSGSGPAYGYLIIDALADGGVKMGLTKQLSLLLSAQTLLGAAKMVLATQKHPAELKDLVATPGGTTVHALCVLEKAGIRSALIQAVEAATLRARELGS